MTVSQEPVKCDWVFRFPNSSKSSLVLSNLSSVSLTSLLTETTVVHVASGKLEATLLVHWWIKGEVFQSFSIFLRMFLNILKFSLWKSFISSVSFILWWWDCLHDWSPCVAIGVWKGCYEVSLYPNTWLKVSVLRGFCGAYLFLSILFGLFLCLPPF